MSPLGLVASIIAGLVALTLSLLVFRPRKGKKFRSSDFQAAKDQKFKPPENSLAYHLLKYLKEKDGLLFTFYDETAKELKSYTHHQFVKSAVTLGNHLRFNLGVNEGDNVILCYPPGDEFYRAVWACFYAGIVAVPVCPPDPMNPVQLLPTFNSICNDCSSKFVLTNSLYYKATVLQELKFWKSKKGPTWPKDINWVATNEIITPDIKIEDLERELAPSIRCGDKIAFLQYTSGSTSMPKGVMVYHRSVINNVREFCIALGVPAKSTQVAWLPHFHDMGLIGFIITPLVWGTDLHYMPPISILKKPYGFMKLLSDTKAFVTSCPNFAYGIMERKITEEQMKTLDLSNWKIAMYGAEPIRWSTLDAFCKKFVRCGFDPNASVPAYGLAENTVCVTTKTPGTDNHVTHVDKDLLEKKNIVKLYDNEIPGKTTAVVSCGGPIGGTFVKIVDKDTKKELSELLSGEIWCRGTSLTGGYLNKPEKNEHDFKATITGGDPEEKWLRTGDLGYMYKGELYIGGRLKDMMIIRGHNIYPQDIEASVEDADPQVRPGCAAAFTVKVDGEDALVVVTEVRSVEEMKRKPELLEALPGNVLQNIRRCHSLPLYAFVALPPRSIAKTTSGKIKRHATKEKFIAKTLKGLISKQWELPPPILELDDDDDGGDAGEDDPSAAPNGPIEADLGGVRSLLAKLPMQERINYFEENIMTVVRSVLGAGHENLALDPEQPLMATGLDSQNAVEVKNKLSRKFGINLPSTLVFDYPNIRAIAGYAEKRLFTSLTDGQSMIQDRVLSKVPRGLLLGSKSSDERYGGPIAIVGVGMRYAGASDVHSFWNNLVTGVDTGREVPSNRWNVDDYYSPNRDARGKLYVRQAHWIDGHDEFDNEFFKISRVEAESMDPQQRVLMEVAWECLHDARLPKRKLANSNTGVFVGICNQEYPTIMSAASKENVYMATGSAHSVASGRISYTFGLRGPSVSIDTACSSSLVSLSLACDSLKKGRCDAALAGGVSLITTPLVSKAFCRTQMLSEHGRCRTFDASASGFARGEGAGMVMLKRLEDAVRDHDVIYSVVRGSAINQDGKSATLTAPNGPAQQNVIREAIAEAGLEPSRIDYLECHGTGTALGDPQEINALAEVFLSGGGESASERVRPLVVGSAKPNVGHCEGSAGIVGVIKAMLTLQHGLAPPILGFRTLNPKIGELLEEKNDFDGFLQTGRQDEEVLGSSDPGILFPTSLIQLPRLPINENKLVAGISSFGFSGTNAHVVLESWPETHRNVILEDEPKTPWGWNHRRFWPLPSGHPFLTPTEPLEPLDCGISLPFVPSVGTSSFALSPSTASLRYLSDHNVGGISPIFPGAGLMEIALATALSVSDSPESSGMKLRDVDIVEPLLLPLSAFEEEEKVEFELRVNYNAEGKLEISISSSNEEDVSALHLRARCEEIRSNSLSPQDSIRHSKSMTLLRSLKSEGEWNVLNGELFYSRIEELGGVVYGPSFRRLSHLWVEQKGWTPTGSREGEFSISVMAQMLLPQGSAFLDPSYRIHPALLDGAFHAVGGALESVSGGEYAFLPASVKEYRWSRRLSAPLAWVVGSVLRVEGSSLITATLTLLDSEHNICAEVLGISFYKMKVSSLRSNVLGDTSLSSVVKGLSHSVEWEREKVSSGTDLLEIGEGEVKKVLVVVSRREAVSSVRKVGEELMKVEEMEEEEESGGRRRIELVIAMPDEPGKGEGEGERIVVFDPLNRESLASVIPPPQDLIGVIYVSSSSSSTSQSSLKTATTPFLHLCQSLIATPIDESQWMGLWVVSTNSQPVLPEDTCPALVEASLWGFAKTCAQESPKLKVGCIDVDELGSGNELSSLIAREMASSFEVPFSGLAVQSAYRKGMRYAPAIGKSHLNDANVSSGGLRIRTESSYIITGGLGGLGLRIANWLVNEKGASQLILLDRDAEPRGEINTAMYSTLVKNAAKVSTVAVDITDGPAVTAGLKRVLDDGVAPFAGIFHLAGLLRDSLISSLTAKDVLTVMLPKTSGALNLASSISALKGSNSEKLDFFFSFSSMAAMIGSIGQAHYSAANNFLDAFARYLRSHNLCDSAQTIQFAIISGIGLGTHAIELNSALGIEPISPEEMLASLDLAFDLRRTRPNLSFVRFGWKKLLPRFPERPYFLHHFQSSPKVQASARVQTSVPGNHLKTDEEEGNDEDRIPPQFRYLLPFSPTERAEAIRATVASAVRTAIGDDTLPSVEIHAPLMDQGLDSLSSVNLRNSLSEKFGIDISVTAMFDYPTVAKISDFLLSKILPSSSPSSSRKKSKSRKRKVSLSTSSPSSSSSSSSSESSDAIAVVGMACRFPGGVSSPEDLWKLSLMGIDTQREIPPDRFDINEYWSESSEGNTMYTRYGAFLDEIDRFDGEFFSIGSAEAKVMDPQQRLLLEVAWEALVDAKQTRDSLRESATSVYVGVMQQDYQDILQEKGEPDNVYNGTGNAISVLAGRISYILGLQGPCLTLDTACSSSLVAIDLAARSLRMGTANLAIASGVNVLTSTKSYVSECKMNMLSSDGSCKTFDSRANGYARGEGAGVVVLKRMEDALRDGDAIHAVLRGSGVNQDGSSTALTAPNGTSQSELIRSVLEEAGLAESDVDYVECHGTGTRLGDPIEVGALFNTFVVPSPLERREKPLVVGAVKTNIGHQEGAAGIAAFLKAVLVAQHGVAAPICHLREINPHIVATMGSDRSAWGIEFPRGIVPLHRASPTIVTTSCSSFGFSGTNAHAVLQSHPSTFRGTPLPTPKPTISWNHRTLHWVVPRPNAFTSSSPIPPRFDSTAHLIDLSSFDYLQGGLRFWTQSIAPSTTLLEIVRQFGYQAFQITNAGITLSSVTVTPRPLLLLGEKNLVQLRLSPPAPEHPREGSFLLHDTRGPLMQGRISLLEFKSSPHQSGASESISNLIVGKTSPRFTPLTREEIYSSIDTQHFVSADARFQSIEKAWINPLDSEAIASLPIVPGGISDSIGGGYLAHPILLESVVVLRNVLESQSVSSSSPYLSLSSVDSFTQFAPLPSREDSLWVSLLPGPDGTFNASFLSPSSLGVLLEMKGVRFAPLPHPFNLRSAWVPQRNAHLARSGDSMGKELMIPLDGKRVVVFCDEGGFATRTNKQLEMVSKFVKNPLTGKRVSLSVEMVTESPGGVESMRELLWPSNSNGGKVRDADIILYLKSLDIDSSSPNATSSTIAISSDLLAIVSAQPPTSTSTSLWIATSGAAGPTSVTNPFAASLWGLALSIRLEKPSLFGGIADLSFETEGPSAGHGRMLLQDIGSSFVKPEEEEEDGEDGESRSPNERLLAYRGKDRFVSRLSSASPSPRISLPPLDSRGVVVISGGCGGIGLSIATHLVLHRGVKKLALLSRRSELNESKRREFEALGVEVRVFHTDVSSPEAVEAMWTSVKREMGFVVGIVHVAGTVSRVALASLEGDGERYWKAASSKVNGGWNLHRMTVDHPTDNPSPLQFFWSVSSTSGVWGGAGLSSYGASNSSLEALHALRLSSNLPSTVVHFGPIVGGFIEESEVEMLQLMGVYPLRTKDCARVFEAAGSGSIVPVPMNTDLFTEVMTKDERWSFLNELILNEEKKREFSLDFEAEKLRRSQAGSPVSTSQKKSFGSDLGYSRAEIFDIVLETLAEIAPGTEFTEDTALMEETGLTSQDAAGMPATISSRIGGKKLPTQLLFRSRTVGDLVEGIFEEVGREDAEGEAQEENKTPPPSKTTTTTTTTTAPLPPLSSNFVEKPKKRLTQHRIFCCTFAGGENDVFNTWGELMPGGIEVRGLTLPGRGAREKESMDGKNVHVIAKEFADSIPMDRDYSLFGVCLGAIIMYEVAIELRKKKKIAADPTGIRMPSFIFAAAVSAPHLYAEAISYVTSVDKNVMQIEGIESMQKAGVKGAKDLTKEQMLTVIEAANFRGVEQLRENDAVYDAVVPRLVADLDIAGSYEYVKSELPLDIPIVSYEGAEDYTILSETDRTFQVDNVKEWHNKNIVTKGLKGSEHVMIEGGDHYFVTKKAKWLCRDITSRLGKGYEGVDEEEED